VAAEGDVVALDSEAFGQFEVGLEQAALQVENPVAGGAMEVVVVVQAGFFVARGLAGQFHDPQGLFRHEVVQRAVDGGDAELRLSLTSALTNLGKAPELKAPQDFLPDEDKPQGIAATLQRFGIERGDGGTPGNAPSGSPAEPEDE
jgi:hypothetical protein